MANPVALKKGGALGSICPQCPHCITRSAVTAAREVPTRADRRNHAKWQRQVDAILNAAPQQQER